jgi:tRNA(Ile)-lysidine synthetase-like protein
MRDTPLYRTVVRFLERTLLGAVDASVAERRRPRKKNQKNQNQKSFGAAATVRPEEEEEEEEEEIEKNDRPPVVPSVGISLSGGVDSMVLAFILKAIADDPRSSFGRFGVVAMHVDYANRPESRAEATFLEDWCQRHGMDITVHRMDETLRRSNTPREEYEVITRAARYDLYKRMRATRFFPAVLVGHHAGDVRENVIANVFRGAHLLSVNGMREEGIVEGVRIWRPMLPHEKADVLDFAHTYGVPYFKDTTPAWSTRGKLRGSLQPLLAEMFGDGYARNLTYFRARQRAAAFDVRVVRHEAVQRASVRLRPGRVRRLGRVPAKADALLEGSDEKSVSRSRRRRDDREVRARARGPSHGAREAIEAARRLDHAQENQQVLRERHDTRRVRRGGVPARKGGTLARVSSDPNKRKNKKKNEGDDEKNAPPPPSPPPPPPPGFGASVVLGDAVNAWGEVTRVGAWSVQAREIPNDSDDTKENKRRLANAEPVDVWRVLRNEIDYLLPSPRCSGARRVYLRPGARLPQFRTVDVAVTDAIPFAVVDVEGAPPDPGEERDAAAAAAAAAEAYRVKTWPASALSGETCVEVRVRFARAKTRSEQELV